MGELVIMLLKFGLLVIGWLIGSEDVGLMYMIVLLFFDGGVGLRILGLLVVIFGDVFVD